MSARQACNGVVAFEKREHVSAESVRRPGGTIQVNGVLDHLHASSVWAVTGGTGRYVLSRGTVTITQTADNRTTATIRLRS